MYNDPYTVIYIFSYTNTEHRIIFMSEDEGNDDAPELNDNDGVNLGFPIVKQETSMQYSGSSSSSLSDASTLNNNHFHYCCNTEYRSYLEFMSHQKTHLKNKTIGSKRNNNHTNYVPAPMKPPIPLIFEKGGDDLSITDEGNTVTRMNEPTDANKTSQNAYTNKWFASTVNEITIRFKINSFGVSNISKSMYIGIVDIDTGCNNDLLDHDNIECFRIRQKNLTSEYFDIQYDGRKKQLRTSNDGFNQPIRSVEWVVSNKRMLKWVVSICGKLGSITIDKYRENV